MITEQTTRQKADQLMTQMIREVHRVFPELAVDVYENGPEREDGMILVHIPVVPGLDHADVADSVTKLLATLQADALSKDGLFVVIGSEMDDAIANPALAAKLTRHGALDNVLTDLYDLLHKIDPYAEWEIETLYYPSPDLAACIILRGVADERVMAQIRSRVRELVERAQTDFGIHVSLQCGERRNS